ncbi:hypothetical protein [Streptomyces sp. NPDC102462]|uniref:hypothetical protein n=1 Tax=Streptomyces sp. NPDC102462 TaxID=3366178 RepID=UPI00381BC17A
MFQGPRRVGPRRLERARQDLADRGRNTTPVHAIAARWGFPHHPTPPDRTAEGP